MNVPGISIASDVRCELGENPLWDERRQCVFSTDITGGKLYQFNPRTLEHRCIYTGEQVGGFTIQENGDLLLFRVFDIAQLYVKDGRTVSLREFKDEGMERFNDVIADPEGRVFAGTKGTTPESGALYRMDRDGSIIKLFSGTRVPNGMGFSPDLKTLYWTCSTSRQLFRFDYDRASGTITNRQLFYEAEPDEGTPDGLTVDASGSVWSARWGASSIKQHAPDGSIVSSIELPVRNVSSLCFGGQELDELFITTARQEAEESELAGALLRCKTPVRGKIEFRSRISAP